MYIVNYDFYAKGGIFTSIHFMSSNINGLSF